MYLEVEFLGEFARCQEQLIGNDNQLLIWGVVSNVTPDPPGSLIRELQGHPLLKGLFWTPQ